MIKIFSLLGCFMLGCAFLHAQEVVGQQIIEDLLESVGEELTEEVDIQEIQEDLERLRQNPLKINLATHDEFIRLHLLSELQINNLIQYREKSGTLYSLYEMATIDGFTPDILQKIEPFICFDLEEKTPGKRKSSGDVFLRSTRSFSSEGETSSRNEGAMERYYLRYKQILSNCEYGFVAEKDPGEAFFSQSNKLGFDYTSAFVNFGIGKNGNRIYAGSYHVRFGQGLLASQGFSMGKSVETTQVFRSNQGVRSYSSTDENQYFRGVAAQITSRNFSFYPFLSLNKLDASVDTLDGKPYFGAFQTSGYHRTPSEIAGENSVNQFTGGGHVTYSHNRWSFGATAVYNRFSMELNRSDEPYNQFLPEGKESVVAGFDWKGSLKNVFIFGEAALSANSGKAFLSGVMLKPLLNAELSMVYRNINKTYFSYFSGSFTESSRVNDEQGMYLGLKVFPVSRWIIVGYVDFFRHQWIKYTTAAPSRGTEFLFQLSYQPIRRTNIYLRFFQEDKEQRLISTTQRYNCRQLINRLRFNLTHDLNPQISIKSRVEFSFYSKQNQERGFLVYQDFSYRPTERRYAMNGHLAYFKTDGYNSRLYAYENDLLYAFSIPALYGNGVRGCLNFQYHFGDRLTFWLKLASTWKFVQNEGEELIAASRKSELKLQIRYQF